MDEAIPLKRCHGPCGRELPHTSEFFHNDTTKKYNGKLTTSCKDCRNEVRRATRKRGKEIVMAPMAEYVTVTDIAQALGINRNNIKMDIKKGILPATKNFDAHRYSVFEWRIARADAEEYIKKRQLRALPTSKKRLLIFKGTPDKCGACGTEKGNILGDINPSTHERYGYLCAKCHQVVRQFHEDTMRLQEVLFYLEYTRGRAKEEKS